MKTKISLTLLVLISISIILINSKIIQAPGICDEDAIGTQSVSMDINPSASMNTESDTNSFTCSLLTTTGIGQCSLTFQYQRATGIT